MQNVNIQNTNILVIEDDQAILEILKYNLQQNNGWNIYTATDGQMGLDMALQIDPDLMVVDWMLPEKSGIDIIKQIRKISNRHIPIIMLTARGEESDKIQSLTIGADDYMIKPFSPRELVARIKASLRRERKTNSMLCCGNISVNLNEKTVYEDGIPLKIVRKEYDILVYLLKNTNRILSREKILNKVWGMYADVDERTIDVHVTRLRKKFNTPQIIESVWGEGYRISDKKD